MKLLVCGGRDYTNKVQAFAALDEVHTSFGITEIIEGGARGADRLGREWAQVRGIPYTTFPADWETHGKSAGFIRNEEMAKSRPDGCLAFPGGAGTRHMVTTAMRYGIPVECIK